MLQVDGATVIGVFGLIFTIVGGMFWLAYRLGKGDSKICRAESDIRENKRTAEYGITRVETKIEAGLKGISDKIDALPCHSPGWSNSKPGQGC